jgi:hypothetical protein
MKRSARQIRCTKMVQNNLLSINTSFLLAFCTIFLAERVGVEPTSPVLPGYPLSRRALSTTQTPLRGG